MRSGQPATIGKSRKNRENAIFCQCCSRRSSTRTCRAFELQLPKNKKFHLEKAGGSGGKKSSSRRIRVIGLFFRARKFFSRNCRRFRRASVVGTKRRLVAVSASSIRGGRCRFSVLRTGLISSSGRDAAGRDGKIAKFRKARRPQE